MHEKLTSYSALAGLCAAVFALYRTAMYEPIDTSLERARVRLRDLGAAWILVALLFLAGLLPGTLQAAKAEAIQAACAARCEVVTVLHAVPKLLQRSHQA
jgi:NADH:ubiquinone oxidoreductase subunit 4 (subunit M)